MRPIGSILPVLSLLALAIPGTALAKGAVAQRAATAPATAPIGWEADTAAGPVTILISITDQKLYVYRGQTIVAETPVSTGRPGNDTPVGVFTILQKAAVHKSNLYDDAPMPFMQRLTWDGVAIHAGRNPGYPDSHGCIRVPTGFAKKLFAATAMGATVEVTELPMIEGAPAPVSDYDATIAANQTSARDLATFLDRRD